MVEFSRERERERKIGSHRVGMQRRRKEGRKEASWRLPVSAASPICLTASRVSRLQLHVLYSRVSMAFSLWYLLFGCPCPCLGTPSGSVSTRELPLSLSLSFSLSLSVEKCLHHPLDDGGISIFTGRYSGVRTYIQMERLAFPRVHSRVQPAGRREGEREALARPKRRRRADIERERERERERGGVLL